MVFVQYFRSEYVGDKKNAPRTRWRRAPGRRCRCPSLFTRSGIHWTGGGLAAAETGFPIQYSGVQPTATATNISTMVNAYFGPLS